MEGLQRGALAGSKNEGGPDIERWWVIAEGLRQSNRKRKGKMEENRNARKNEEEMPGCQTGVFL